MSMMVGMTGEEAWTMANSFSKKVALGITDVIVDNAAKTITFKLLADGSQHTLQFDELTTTTTRELVASITQGNIYPGKVYPVGTEYETILEDLITQYLKPEVKLTIEPATTLYDIVNDTVDKIEMYATVTKKTSDITQIEFFVNGTSKNVVTSNVANGGLFEYIYEPATPINADVTFKAVATDSKNETASATKTIKFVAKSYYGIVDATIGAPTEAVVKTLDGVLKDTKNYVYEGITTDWGKVCYAYPASFGNLSSIKDMVNNLNYTTEFTKTTLTVDGIEYVCYTQTNASAATDIEITFA